MPKRANTANAKMVRIMTSRRFLTEYTDTEVDVTIQHFNSLLVISTKGVMSAIFSNPAD